MEIRGQFKMIKIIKMLMVLSACMVWTMTAEAEEAIGTVSAVSGEAYAINVDGSRVDLAMKSPIFQNQTVITGEDGKVQIIFMDNSIFTISANTELLIDEYVFDPRTGEGKSIMNATKGVFKFVTGKIAKNNREDVKVETPFATIGVRGSGGLVAVDPTLGTRVGLTQCCLEVSTAGSSSPVPLNQMGTFMDIKDPSAPAPAPQPVDASFNKIIQDNFGTNFGEDDGTEIPVAPVADNAPEGEREPVSQRDAPRFDERLAEDEEGLGFLGGLVQKGEEGAKQLTDATQTQKRPDIVQVVNVPGLDNFGTFQPKDPDFIAKVNADAGQVKTYDGFIGGFISTDADSDGNKEYRRLTNTVADGEVDRGVNITVDTTNNTVNAKLSGMLDDGNEAADANGTTQEIIEAKFGGAANSTARHLSAYRAQMDDTRVDTGVVVVGDSLDDTVYTYGNAVTSNEQSFVPGPGHDAYGSSVAVSGDWMIVGAPIGDGSSTDDGYAELYRRNSAGDWILSETLSSPDASLDGQFGYDVAIQGKWAFVGAKAEDGSATNAGAVHVYRVSSAGVWTFQQSIEGVTPNDYFGAGLDVNGGFMTMKSGSGDVKVYKNVAGTWVDRTGMTSLPTVPNDASVAVSENGDFVAVGLANQSSGDGRVMIYKFNGTNYTVHKTINGNAGSNLGADIAIKDGMIVMGAPAESKGYLIELEGTPGTYGVAGATEIDGGAGNGLGETVAFNGNRVVLGNSTYNTTGTGGAFKIFLMNDENTAVISSSNLYAGAGSPSSTLGSDVDVNDMILSYKGAGVLVSDFVAENRCNNCDYAHWGIWAGEIGNAGLVSDGDIARAEAVYYVAGEMTDATTLGAITDTSVNFNGVTAGAINDNGTLTHHTGAFGANVNFATRNVAVNNFTLGDYALTSGSASWDVGHQAFTGSLAIDDGTNFLNGDMNGAFFGPSAEDMGGNFSVENSGGDITSSGVYLGTSQ